MTDILTVSNMCSRFEVLALQSMYCRLQMKGSGTVSVEPCVFALRAAPVISTVLLRTTVNSSRGYVLREFVIHYGLWGVETGCVSWSCLGKERLTIHWFSSTKSCTIIWSPTPYLYEIDVRPYPYDTSRTSYLNEIRCGRNFTKIVRAPWVLVENDHVAWRSVNIFVPMNIYTSVLYLHRALES